MRLSALTLVGHVGNPEPWRLQPGVEVGNQTLDAMPLVFEFLALNVTWLDG